jgi:site-specific recombinase XerD
MGFGRSVVMGEATSRMMREYLLLLDKLDVNDALWISVSGKPLTRHGIRFVFERFSKLLKPHNLKVSSHKMRRTSARSYIENNVNSQIICSIFGWHSYSMIDLYAKSSSRAVENAIKDTSLIDSIISTKPPTIKLNQMRN